VRRLASGPKRKSAAEVVYSFCTEAGGRGTVALRA
jgi:hypothetical protein